MAEPIVPAWEKDPLSVYLSMAERNARVSALNWPDVYEVQQRAHALLLRVGEVVEHDLDDARHLAVPRMLLLRSHSAILTTMRLAMSGQAVEAQAVLRTAIESAWYALHINRDPAPPARARVWWSRGETAAAIQACKREFTVGNVRATHEGLDAPTAVSMLRLYEDVIDFGAHPNQGGVSMALRISDRTVDSARVGVGFLHPGGLPSCSALKAAVDVTIGLAKIVGFIYPERFRIASLDEDVNRLIRHSAEVFQRRATAFRGKQAGA